MFIQIWFHKEHLSKSKSLVNPVWMAIDELAFKIEVGILQIFVVSVDNLSSLSGLDYLKDHSPTVETVGYYRASQGDEEPRPNPLTTATFC